MRFGRLRRGATGLTLAVLLSAPLGAACTSRSDAVGGGAKTDICLGYRDYDDLDEPDPGEVRELVRYADGFVRVLDRIEIDRHYTDKAGKRKKPSQEVTADFETVKREMREYRDAVRAANGDLARIEEATTALAVDRELTEADARLSRFHADQCR